MLPVYDCGGHGPDLLPEKESLQVTDNPAQENADKSSTIIDTSSD